MLIGNRDSYDAEIAKLEIEIEENKNEIKGLVSTLANASGITTEGYIKSQINDLHNKTKGLNQHLAELKELTANHALSDIEFDLLAQLLVSFKDTVDRMTVKQKRTPYAHSLKKLLRTAQTFT